MIKKIIIGLILILASHTVNAQKKLRAMIMAKENGKVIGVEGVSISWLNGTDLEYTDDKGWFTINYHNDKNKLIISKLGYKSDTLVVKSNDEFHHFITADNTIKRVIIKSKNKNNEGLDAKKATNVEVLGSEELAKAACCNLSESFENTPSVDVVFKDPITGSTQIEMLGLKSPYVLFTQGNIPNMRGAAQAFGLTLTPGTWLKNIQIIKGAGSVVNGYESISGQINTNTIRPRKNDKILVNLFANAVGALETNIQFSHKINKKWNTGLFVHGNKNNMHHDKNNDGFIDNPMGERINVLNSWEYRSNNTGWRSIIELKYVNDEKTSGQIAEHSDHSSARALDTVLKYQSNVNTKRYETHMKIGKIYKDFPYRSIGFQATASHHNQKSFFGPNEFNIKHQSAYFNAIYQSVIKYTNHKFKTGLSGTFDKFDETANYKPYARQEKSIGAFFEYTYTDFEKITIIPGIRADIHNLIGFFVTPRLHIKYNPNKKLVIRASAGTGRRISSIFSENQRIFASSRNIQILDNTGKIYGLNPEKAINYGIGLMQKYKVWGKKGNITFDAYRTDFQEKVVVDYETFGQARFYNLKGEAYANSLQIGLELEPIKNLAFKVAYKYTGSNTTYKNGLLQNPYTALNRYFANLTYKTKKTDKGGFWMFNVTANQIGKQRLPYTGTNADAHKRPNYSPSYSLINAQINKTFNKNIKMYIGAENIGNYTQDNPIIASEKPFGPNFDASIIYAPIMGIRPYIGLTYKL